MKGKLLLTCALAICAIGAINGSQKRVIAEEAQSFTYSKVVDTTLSDLTGDYLIVNEASKVVFDGSLESLDVANNNVSASEIKDGVIVGDYSSNMFTFAKEEGKETYTIKSASGYFIGGKTGENKLYSSKTSSYSTSVSINASGNVVIKAPTTLRFNSATDQMRFRYMKSGDSNVQLYKLDAVAEEGQVTVTYESNGGTYISNLVLDSGSVLNAPSEPTKNGYNFGGWYSDDKFTTPYTFGSAITEDITIYAKWLELDETPFSTVMTSPNGFYKTTGEVVAKLSPSDYVIQDGENAIELNDDSDVLKDVKVGNSIVVTFAKSKTGEIVTGSDIKNVSIVDADDVTIDAVPVTDFNDANGMGEYVEFKNIKLADSGYTNYQSKKVGFNLDNEDFIISALNADYVEGLTLDNASSFRNKYVDVKGVLDTSGDNFRLLLTSIALSSTATVSFNTLGGSNVASVDVPVGNTLPLPDDPTKEASANEKYAFDSWYLDENCEHEFDLDSAITSDISLYAKWNVTPIGIDEKIKEVSNKVSLEFDYTRRTHFVDEGVSYSSVDISKINSEANFSSDGGSYNTDGYYQMKSDGNSITYSIPSGYDAPIGLKVKAIGTSSVEEYSSIRFVSWREVLESDDPSSEKIDAKNRYILTEQSFVLKDTEDTYERVFEHIGSATHISIILDKITGSNCRITSLEIGKDREISYEQFKNVKLNFSYSFDASLATDCAEIGIALAKGEEAGLELLENGLTTFGDKLIKYTNENKDLKFVASISLEDLVDMYSEDIYAAVYVKKTDGKYYFGDINERSLEEVIAKYLSMGIVSDEAKTILRALDDSIYNLASNEQ